MLATTIALGTCLSAGVAGFGCARAVGGHTVLDLHGTDAEIGAMYAEILREPLLADYLPMMDRMHGELPGAFRRIWEGQARRFPGLFSPEMQARIDGFESALGVGAGTFRRNAWFSELGTVGPALQVALGGGCASFVVPGKEGTLHARNVDFWGMGFWQTHAAVVFVDPRRPDGTADGIRYAQVSDLGEIFAGTTGVNERGVVVTTHVHVSRDAALLDGRVTMGPLGLLALAVDRRPRREVSVYRMVETVLRRAESVAEGVAILSSMRPVGTWSFILSDPSGHHAVVGATPREVVALDEDLATNFYLDPGMYARELRPVRGPVEGARLRYDRAATLVDAHQGPWTVDDAAAILRDRYDIATGTSRAVSPNSIASPDATQSVVFDVRADGDHRLWLAEPHADGVTPAPFAPYVELPFRAGFDAVLCPDGCVARRLGYATDPVLDPPMTAYAHAMSTLLDGHDPAGATRELRAIDGDDGVELMTAWLAASNGDLHGAARDLERVAPEGLSAHHQALYHLLRGDLAASCHQREAARTAWASVLEVETGPRVDHPVADVARSRLAGASRPRFPTPDLKFQDVFDP